MADVPLTSTAVSSSSSSSSAVSWPSSSTGASGLSLHADAVRGWLLFNVSRPAESTAARLSYETAFITQLQFELGQVTGVRQERIELGAIDIARPDQLVGLQMLPSTDPAEMAPIAFADDLYTRIATNDPRLADFTTTRQIRNVSLLAVSSTLCLRSDGLLGYQLTCGAAAPAASPETMLLGLPFATTLSLFALLLVALLIGALIFWYMRKSKREEQDFLERAEAERHRLTMRILNLQGGGNGGVELLIPPDGAVVPAAPASSKSKPDKASKSKGKDKSNQPAVVPVPVVLPPSSPSRVDPPEIIPQWGSSLFIPQHLKSWAAIVTARTAGHEAPDAHEHKEPNLAHISAVKRLKQQQDVYRQKQKEQQEALLRQQLQAQHELQLQQQLQNPRASESPPPCTPRDEAANDECQEVGDLDDERQAEAADRDAPDEDDEDDDGEQAEDDAANDEDDGEDPPEEPEEQGHSSSFDELPPQPSSTRTTDVHVSLAASPRADSVSRAQRPPIIAPQYQQHQSPQQHYQQQPSSQQPHSPSLQSDASWIPDPRTRPRMSGAAPSLAPDRSSSGRYVYSAASPSGSSSAASPPLRLSVEDRPPASEYADDVLAPPARVSSPPVAAASFSPPPVRQMRAEPIRARRVPPSAINAAVAATNLGPSFYSAPRANAGAVRSGGVLRPPPQQAAPPQQFSNTISGGPNGVVMPSRLATGQQPMVRLHGPGGSQQMPTRSYVMQPPQQRAPAQRYV